LSSPQWGNDKLIETVLPLFVSKMLAFP
jgi:hypothetical protein